MNLPEPRYADPEEFIRICGGPVEAEIALNAHLDRFYGEEYSPGDLPEAADDYLAEHIHHDSFQDDISAYVDEVDPDLHEED